MLRDLKISLFNIYINCNAKQSSNQYFVLKNVVKNLFTLLIVQRLKLQRLKLKILPIYLKNC